MLTMIFKQKLLIFLFVMSSGCLFYMFFSQRTRKLSSLITATTYNKSTPYSGTSHVVFLKTHKTASSSVQNILMRYGIVRNYTFVIPEEGFYLGYPEKFQKNMTRQLKDNLQYNIYTHHSRFSKRGISSLMPNDTFYFTILRDPDTHFESLYSYYGLDGYYGMSLEKFVSVRGPEWYSSRNHRPYNGRIGRNQMCFDLGFDVESFDNDTQIAAFAQQLEADFDLILINELLPESLILLRDALCWTTEDVVVFHHNARKDKFRTELTEELKAGIQYWNHADVYIYNHFYNILEQKIADYGQEKMAKEVAELEKLNLEWFNSCVDETKTKNLKGRSNVEDFALKNNSVVCQNLIKTEPDFTKEIRNYMQQFYEPQTK